MSSPLRPALTIFLGLTLITGVVYPLVVTGIAQTFFPHQANGSLISVPNAPALGSSLIGQEFSSADPKVAARYFWGRLSATSPVPYTAFNADKSTGSSGSNLGPTNPALIDNVKARIAALAAADAACGYARSSAQKVPVDLVTSSGGGLDPHISPASAEYQLPRIARSRNMDESAVRTLIARHTQPRALGIFGEPCVNVLELNLDLDGNLPPR